METELSNNTVLVSVVITCYNHGNYLANAIESVSASPSVLVEIVVVDDGSTDHTKLVCGAYPGVKYIYQHNQGLSAARNTGIVKSSGKYLVFLDADDWLLRNAIDINLSYLTNNPGAAFVSGAHIKLIEDINLQEEKKVVVNDRHYAHFLKGNYVAMHATVMYQRWVFDQYRFDTTLNAFEDYDMYLKISRSYPVIHHQELLAVYRIHTSNMSANNKLMLDNALNVLKRQEAYLSDEKEKRCYRFGIKYWKNYYTGILYRNVNTKPWSAIDRHEISMLFKNNLTLYLKLLSKKILHVRKK
ncbi:MAG: glycosyltransferase family 2 protein [Bacteroidota bacterium]